MSLGSVNASPCSPRRKTSPSGVGGLTVNHSRCAPSRDSCARQFGENTTSGKSRPKSLAKPGFDSLEHFVSIVIPSMFTTRGPWFRPLNFKINSDSFDNGFLSESSRRTKFLVEGAENRLGPSTVAFVSIVISSTTRGPRVPGFELQLEL